MFTAYQANVTAYVVSILSDRVGNKIDLEVERQVTTEEGKELSQLYGCAFIETSAKRYINIEELWFNLVREVVNLQPKKKITDQYPL